VLLRYQMHWKRLQDMYIQFKARGHIQFTVYNKRDDMIVLQNYRRFPHITSTMAHSIKYNVFKSQLHRFASRCNHKVFDPLSLSCCGSVLSEGYPRLRPTVVLAAKHDIVSLRAPITYLLLLHKLQQALR
jgi:hypothetical protein